MQICKNTFERQKHFSENFVSQWKFLQSNAFESYEIAKRSFSLCIILQKILTFPSIFLWQMLMQRTCGREFPFPPLCLLSGNVWVSESCFLFPFYYATNIMKIFFNRINVFFKIFVFRTKIFTGRHTCRKTCKIPVQFRDIRACCESDFTTRKNTHGLL